MPYYHVGCGGEVGLWTRKCHKCKEKWPLGVLFARKSPKDMVYQKTRREITSRGRGSYAKWANSAPPGVAEVASYLPNWPRWARILLVVMLALLVAVVVVLIRR